MQKLKHYQHYPTLKTILMIEDTLRKSTGELLSRNELDRRLPRKVDRNTLNIALRYLEESNKIMDGLKGIQWIWSDGKIAGELLKRGKIISEG